jgi:hypothetical protein
VSFNITASVDASYTGRYYDAMQHLAEWTYGIYGYNDTVGVPKSPDVRLPLKVSVITPALFQLIDNHSFYSGHREIHLSKQLRHV